MDREREGAKGEMEREKGVRWRERMKGERNRR